MSDSKVPEVSTAAPDVAIDRSVAVQSRNKSSGIVARGEVVHLRDDPEAKATFLSTFTADDEKRIMRKVDMRFVFLAGVMYLIKQVSENHSQAFARKLTGNRLTKTMQRTSVSCTSANPPTS